MIAYASYTGTRRNLRALRGAGWRMLVSATGRLNHNGFPYALDNGAWTAFQQGRAFDDSLFVSALRKMGRSADWTVLPDIVQGGSASLEMSLRWMRQVLDESPRALLAVQDGMALDDVRAIVGGRIGIFVGGSTEWKERTMPEWCELARSRECWAHIGRVNTIRRIVLCGAAGATSFDGTSASRFAKTLPKLDGARRQMSFLMDGGGRK